MCPNGNNEEIASDKNEDEKFYLRSIREAVVGKVNFKSLKDRSQLTRNIHLCRW